MVSFDYLVFISWMDFFLTELLVLDVTSSFIASFTFWQYFIHSCHLLWMERQTQLRMCTLARTTRINYNSGTLFYDKMTEKREVQQERLGSSKRFTCGLQCSREFFIFILPYLNLILHWRKNYNKLSGIMNKYLYMIHSIMHTI